MGTDVDDRGKRQGHRRAEWLLPQLIAERGIRSATELQRRLVEDGVKVSRQQISKLVANMPSRLSLDLLAGLARILRCGAGDLIHVGTDLDSGGNDESARGSTALVPAGEIDKVVQGASGLRTGAAPAGAGPSEDADVPEKWLKQLLALPFRPFPLRASARPGETSKRRS